VAHHLGVDGVSWRILVSDLQVAWTAAATGEPVVLPATGTSFRAWAERLAADAVTPARRAEGAYWQRVVADDVVGLAEPLDPRRDTGAAAVHHTMRLPTAATTALITSVAATLRSDVHELLLTALAMAVAALRSDVSAVVIDVEGHGREELWPDADLSRTVGWFTSLYPVRIDLQAVPKDGVAGSPAFGQAIKAIKEQLRGVPGRGLGYGLLRYLDPEWSGRLAASARTPAIGFNYLGRLATTTDHQPWQSLGGLGGTADPEAPLAHALEITVVTLDGDEGPVLAAQWTWSSPPWPHGFIARLAERWERALTQLIAHAATPLAGGLTPSDLPLVALSQSEIEELERTL
jgi:non-ribosomal peptide synthase protein (TIGR01720 family)